MVIVALRAAAVFFACAAAFHVAACLVPSVDPSSPAWRHALFVVVNALAAAGLWTRPRGFAIAFALLVAQQLWSHGGAALAAWRDERRLDLVSIAIVIFLPLVLALLVVTGRNRASPRRSD